MLHGQLATSVASNTGSAIDEVLGRRFIVLDLYGEIKAYMDGTVSKKSEKEICTTPSLLIISRGVK